MQIAIGMPVGYPSVAAGKAGIFDHLINDDFEDDRAAGAALNHAATPGPGQRYGVDTGNYLSLADDKLAISGGGSTWGTSIVYYVLAGRVPGQVMVAEITLANKLFAVVGFGNNSIGLGDATHCVQFYFRDVLKFWGGGLTYNYGAYNTATSYVVAAVLRATGGFLFIKNYTGAYWTLLEILHSGTASPDPQINSFNASLTADYVRVPSARWMPSPVLSDGFSAWGTSDGLGHAEGIAGGLGSGGGSVAITAGVGTWGAAGGVASASALSSGIAVATADCGKADVIATAKVTRAGGNAGVVVRYVDASNYVYAYHTGTQVSLRKVVAGVDSQVLAPTNATYVAGARLRISAEGTAFRVTYNLAQVGAEQTISDAALQSGTRVGMYTSNTGNTFDDLVVYARGSGGEYAALDAF